MAIGKDGAALRQLRTIFNAGPLRDLADGQLLERFATERGEAAELAFAALVERHGPMVLRACRGVLADPDDAQDAFQATFLVLVRKARGLWVRDSLGPWLHRVAYRTASCARKAEARRRRHERGASTPEEGRPAPAPDFEIGRLLHEEIERLPERFRAPLVLCDLEGRSHEEAARQLGWPIGTVKSRLARGRARLRDRLVRRGLGPAAGMLAAAPPTLLSESTTVAVVRLATARAIAPGSVVSLAREVLRSMIVTQWIKVGSALLVGVAAATGVGMLAQDGAPGPASRPGAARVDDLPSVAVRPGKLRVASTQRGVVEATRAAAVYSAVEGLTSIVSIRPEGTRVRKGEVVCELDTAMLRDAIKNQQISTRAADAGYRQAELGRNLAEMALKEFIEGKHKEEVTALIGEKQAAGGALRRANARIERTRLALKRMDEVLAAKGGALTPADIVARLEVADRLDAAELGLHRDHFAVELAESKFNTFEKYSKERIVRGLQGDVARDQSIELARKSAWALEQDKASKLERQIKASTIRAPGDGLIVHANTSTRPEGTVEIEEGATVRERQKILDVVDVDGPMEVLVKVPEAIVDRFSRGQTARIKVDAFGDRPLTGVVGDVSPLPDPTTFFRDKRKVYSTRLRIDQPFPNLRPGMTAESEILIRELDSVLAVPVSAVASYDGKDHLAVKKPEGGVDWREVTLGASDGHVVEIRQGLRAGEVVVLAPLSLMTEAERRARSVPPTRPANLN